MTFCKSLGLIGTVAFSAILTLSGPSVSHAADAGTSAALDPEVLRLREAAWRAYFAGDEKALGEMLPADFIGINMTDGPFVTRAKALEEARSFRASGGRLVSLEFPETRAQHYGDVMIFYGRYTAVLESGGPERKTQTLRGRLTEMFLRRAGRWVHTGWHLDTESAP
jgi:Domain of unknown function (DUF4440)